MNLGDLMEEFVIKGVAWRRSSSKGLRILV